MKLKRILSSSRFNFVVGKIYDGELPEGSVFYSVKDEDGRISFGTKIYWEEVKEPVTITVGDLV